MKNCFFSLLTMSILLMCFPGGIQAAATETAATEDPSSGNVFVEKGVRVEFSIEHAQATKESPRPLREAEMADIKFTVTDATTGAPISPLQPAVWISLIPETESPARDMNLTCKEKVSRYLQQTLNFQADIDLNKFYILVMNNDHSISVVDPILGISGITQLYTMILLEESGEDWVMDAREEYLYVTMPRAGKVAVIDLERFKVVDNIEVGKNPLRIAMQPDGRYVWVANNGSNPDETGVTVIDTNSRKTVAHISTGAGHHEIALSSDSLHAYVTNSDANTLSVIDTQKLKKIKDLKTGKRPIAVEFSPLGNAAYVASEADGRIIVVDDKQHEIMKDIETLPGLIALRFDPEGRWGFAANPIKNQVHIIDASNNAIAHTLEIPNNPHQFSFTDTFAYIRSLGAAEMHLVQLNQLGRDSAPGASRIPIGSKPPGQYLLTSVANAVTPTGEWGTVIAANPMDKAIYYYMEGMVAPMGTFPTYGRIPRAVRVVDRSLNEKEKGVYSAQLKIPKDGKYDVAFLIDSPWLYNCFDFTAEANPILHKEEKLNPVKISVLTQEKEFPVGEEIKIRFSLTRPPNAQPLVQLADVEAIFSRPPGNWKKQLAAKPLEGGQYEVTTMADRPGIYTMYFAIPSLNIDYLQLPYLVIRAHDKKTAKGE